jgi:diaminohydroxyphosphoribosylaminopyrimidine deaminase/5-amino-6-(5-phosphoribosylamino)uracil reductase
MVGCVIVQRGRVIGEGYHRRFGGPHAEIDALRRCSSTPRGATVYVTLEPCCHHGKTPPCTDALIEANIARVVAPIQDPNPTVAGAGFRILRGAGIRVDVGRLAEEAAQLNAPFIKLVEQRRPWVILKWAQSVDGKIATRTGDAKWISDDRSRAHAHRIRGRLDAIIVGSRTVETDDPLLTCRVGRPRRIATRIVLDSRLQIPLTSRLVRTAAEIPCWIFCGKQAPARRARKLEAAGCRVYRVRETRAGLSLSAMLNVLGKHDMTNVLVEGGGKTLGAFFDWHFADELQIYVAPRLIGGASAPGPLHARGPARVADSFRFPPDTEIRRVGNGHFIRALVRAR